MEHLLQVTTRDNLVGKLGHDALNDKYTFVYDEAWRQRDGFLLSPHIPTAGEPASSSTIQRFLANLLPEGRALDVAVAATALTKDNFFGLVRVLGQEPVGALSFLPEQAKGQMQSAPAEPVRRVIASEELSERIRDRDTLPFPVWDRKIRLSIAGYQDKLQVLVEGEQISLADGTLSSTHILKPDSRNPSAPHMVANEHFCMRLAAEMGLPAAPVELRRVPEPVLLIQRFDRKMVVDASGGSLTKVHRIHVIDGCQALDLPVSFKYERNFGIAKDVRHIREGASFARLLALDAFMENPAKARAILIQWALFQLLIGNSDAHGKNISYFVTNAGLAPAPFYDLVSVNIYGHVEQEMAMGYGDAFRLEDITALELADFAYRTRTPPGYVSRQLAQLCRRATFAVAQLVCFNGYTDDERALVADIAALINIQAQRLAKIAPLIPKVEKVLFTS
ncbi:HipA domain-containing protein [Massilia sp. SR12]